MLHKMLYPLALALFTSLACTSQAQEQLIEVRVYQLTSAEKAAQFDHMMKEGALPALKRLNIAPVGVFEEQEKKAEADKYRRVVVIPYPSADAFVNMSNQLGQDSEFVGPATDYLMQEKDSPAYTRIDSILLKSFSGMPKLQVPGSGKDRTRMFELRTYESHSELKGKAKVMMFNDGEIDLFNRVGLNGVFYGEAIAGKNLPQLTYMLVHDDADKKKSAWQTFINHAEWKEMKGLEKYKDTVSNITVHNLIPVEYSDIR